MPQSSISNSGQIPEEQMQAVLSWHDAAVKYGLQGEWLEWYTLGIQQGMTPVRAATEAGIEWDLG